jgi:hypothetical protein
MIRAKKEEPRIPTRHVQAKVLSTHLDSFHIITFALTQGRRVGMKGVTVAWARVGSRRPCTHIQTSHVKAKLSKSVIKTDDNRN